MNQLENKMEDFLISASEVLANIKKEQTEAKKLLSTLKGIAVVICIALIGWMMRVEVGLAERPVSNATVSKKDAIAVHMLNAANIENISKVLTPDCAKIERIKQLNYDYVRMVETIYNLNFN